MNDKRQMIPLAGLLSTVVLSVYMVVQLNAQSIQARDFTNAAIAEVKDMQGQVILRGQFALVEEQDDDIERRAILAPIGGDAGAAGEAEVEFSREAPSEQEIELSVSGLAPETEFTFVIDGAVVTTVSTNRHGRAQVELDVPMPGGGTSR